jgi:hypothetical protein
MTCALLLMMCGASAGCTARPQLPDEPTSTSPTTATDEPSSESASGLVGSWASSDGDATLAYRFEADGGYRFAGVLTQPVPEGTREYRHFAEGVAEVAGATLVLRPTRATSSRSDPSSPAGDYTDRPEPLVERRFSWRVEGDVLTMVGDDGNELTLDRQPS